MVNNQNNLNKSYFNSSSMVLRFLVILAIQLLLMQNVCLAQKDLSIDTAPIIIKTLDRSNTESTRSEGLLLEAPPTYVHFTGDDGLQLEISKYRKSKFDYTIMFWFRSAHSYEDLLRDEFLSTDKRYYLFQIGDLETNPGCYIQKRKKDSGPNLPEDKSLFLRCHGDSTFAIDLLDIPDIQSWIHLTYSAKYEAVSDKSLITNKSYIQLDILTYSKLAFMSEHLTIDEFVAYYGMGTQRREDVDGLGFNGHFRQFWMTLGYLEPFNVQYLMHQYKVLDYSTLGYYKFEQTILLNRYDDAFRKQKARYTLAPKFVIENIAAPFCNSIPQKYVEVPQFYKSAGETFSKVLIPKFQFKSRSIGYTITFWVKNFGQHSYEQDPLSGRENHHFIRLDESFALWYDTPTSFRIYIYAKDNFQETFSDPVFLPLYDWINIQIAIDQNEGITVMTFNQNGDRQQLIQNKGYLGWQYPTGTLSLFKAFIGIPYKLYIWERFIKLPVDFSSLNLQDELIVSYDFTRENFTNEVGDLNGFQGWLSMIRIGQDLPAIEGQNFDFIYANLPSEASFQNPDKKGQLEATSTQWNSVTCPSPKFNLMMLGATDTFASKFSMAILVDQTEQYTVEFWFKPNLDLTDALKSRNIGENGKSVTFLHIMKGQEVLVEEPYKAKDAMAIYVEDQLLKCAPFGYGKDEDSVLTYGTIDPLTVDSWQHISCIFYRNKYVKGQYLAINMEPEVGDTHQRLESFQDDILRPQQFARSIYKKKEITFSNFSKQHRWTILLGNDYLSTSGKYYKHFSGSFKDVRLWKSARSDSELYSYRFNQVAAPQQDLAGNLKFMDGNPDIYNSADLTTFPVIEPGMQLIESDGKNIVCATDTYFNPTIQKCSRYPYPGDISIVYMVTNNVQYGHQMIVQKIAKSTMFLAGDKFQPKTSSEWSMDNLAVEQRYFQDNSKNSYNFDPIYMGDFKKYDFVLKLKDIENHNFFLSLKQTIIPRKCIQIVDLITDEPRQKQSHSLGLIEDDKEIKFEFKVKKIDGCSDEFENDILRLIAIESQPPMLILNQFVQTFDRVTQTFTVTMPTSMLRDRDMPKNIPIDFIFVVGWTSEVEIDGNKDTEPYMNIVYTVTLASEIKVNYETNLGDGQTTIDKSKKVDLIIYASKSTFLQENETEQIETNNGLTFRWECGVEGDNIKTFTNDFLAAYCEQWRGSEVLQVPNVMIGNELNNKPIRIRVIVTSIEASELDEAERADSENSEYRDFIWLSTTVPGFSISLPKNDDDDTVNRLIVSKEQKISIVPENGDWRIADGDYKVDFVINEIPALDNPTFTQMDQASLSAIIPTGVLSFSKEYELVVTVRNEQLVEEGQILTSSETITFKTGTQPEIEQMTIEPKDGEMFSTEFQIILSGYKSSVDTKNMKYNMYGLEGNGSEIRLTPISQDLDDAEQHQTEKFVLPQVIAVKIVIEDQYGEQKEIIRDVTVTKSTDVTWTNIYESRKATILADLTIISDSNPNPDPNPPPNAVQWSSYQSIGQQANQAAVNDPSDALIKDAKAVNKKIAKDAFDDIVYISQTSNTADANFQLVIESIVETIGTVTQPANAAQMEPEILQGFTETMEYVLRVSNIMTKINQDKEKRESFVRAMGNLLEQTSKQALVMHALAKYQKDNVEELLIVDWTQQVSDTSVPSGEEVIADDAPESTRRLLRRQQEYVMSYDGIPASELIRALQSAAEDQSTESALETAESETAPEAGQDGQENEAVPETKEDSIDILDEELAEDEIKCNGEFQSTYETCQLLDMRNLIKKVVVLKNLHLDQLCDVAEKGKTIQINTPQMESIVEKIDSFNQMKDTETRAYETQNSNLSVNIPVGKLMSETRVAEPLAFDWLCIQTNFMKANPVAGFTIDQQYYFKDQYISQFGSIDSNGNRLINQKGVQNLDADSFTLQYKQELTRANYFYNNQTVCAHYDGNDERFTGQTWSTEKSNSDELKQAGLTFTGDCSTDYRFDDSQQSIVCKCSNLHNFYYALITDQGRSIIEPIIEQDINHLEILAIAIPLIFIGLVFPCVMVFLDAYDYQKVEDNFYAVDDLTIAKLQNARNYLCKQMIYYNEKEIEKYLKLNDGDFRSGSSTAFLTFHRTLHPYFSLFTRFDYRLKRFTRFMLVLGQISLITICLWFCYSQQFIDWGWIEAMGEQRPYYVSLGLSLLTLPMPRRFICCFETQMYVLKVNYETKDEEKDEENQSLANTKNQETEQDDLDKPIQPLGGKKSDDTVANAEDAANQDEIRPVLFDRWLQCKAVMILMIIFLWLASIGITYQFAIWAGQTGEDSELESFVELTPTQVKEFVWTWYMAIFVWGLVINEFRIVLISLLAPIVSQTLFARHMEIIDPNKHYDDEHYDDGDAEYKPAKRENALRSYHNDWCARASFATCVFIAPESIDIALDALYTIAIKNDTAGKFKVKEDEQEVFDEAMKVRDMIKRAENKNKRKAAHDEKKADVSYSAAGYNTEDKLNGQPNVAIELQNIKGGDLDGADGQTGAKPTTGKKNRKNKKGADKDGKKKKNKKKKDKTQKTDL